MSKTNVDLSQSIDTIRNQLTTYGGQIQEYLKNMNATIDDYKFSIEKKDNGGLTVDIMFKATIQATQS
jgi:small nuclear ribonucleoprotein (snRNP)-like protein